MPWILTVAASTIDRKIRTTAVLENNKELDGESTFETMDFALTQLSFVYPRSTAHRHLLLISMSEEKLCCAKQVR